MKLERTFRYKGIKIIKSIIFLYTKKMEKAILNYKMYNKIKKDISYEKNITDVQVTVLKTKQYQKN